MSGQVKTRLWNRLRQKERTALRAVSQELGFTPVKLADEGKDALALLNRHMKKSPQTKLKRYTIEEVEVACAFVEEPLFLKQLEVMLLDIWKKSEGDAGDDEQSGPQGDDPVERLCERLEREGAFVHALVPDGPGFGFKLTTKMGTYLSHGSAREILKLVKHDNLLAQRFRCPFCEVSLDCTARDQWGILECSGCGALCGFIPSNLAQKAVREVVQRWGKAGLWTVLEHWEALFLSAHEAQCSWFNMPLLEKEELHQAVLSVVGPAPCTPVKREVPLLRLWEEEECMRIIPSCSHCCHCLTVDDWRQSFCIEQHYCMYPHQPFREFSDGWSMMREYGRFHTPVPSAIIRNAFLKEWLDELTYVSDQTRELEAFCQEDGMGFQGPICADFVFNEEHIDLEERGGPYRPEGQTTIVFGVKNLQALREEKRRIEEQRKIELLKEKIHRLKQPQHQAAFSHRVEMGSSFNAARKLLVDFLCIHFSPQELELWYRAMLPFFPFNVSNRAKSDLLERALKRCR